MNDDVFSILGPSPVISISLDVAAKRADMGGFLEEKLGLREQRITRFGEIQPKRFPNQYWFRVVREDSRSVQKNMQKALDVLSAKKDFLTELVQQHECELLFTAYVEAEENGPEIILSHAQLQFLADVGASFALDV